MIETRQGSWFVQAAHRADIPTGPTPVQLDWPPVLTDRIRITGSHLHAQSRYVMQFTEIEVRGL